MKRCLKTAMVILITITTCRSLTVHYTTPGGPVGNHLQVAGLWRGDFGGVDSLLTTQGKVTGSLRDPDFICAQYRNTFNTGLSFSSISLDAITHDVLLKWNHNSARAKTTMLKGNLCAPQADCINTERLRLLTYSLITQDIGAIQPILSWGSSVYFIYTPSFGETVYFGFKQQLEFRKLGNCSLSNIKDPVAEKVDIDGCSTLLANVSVGGEEGPWVQPGSMLYAVGDNRGSSRPVFLTTLLMALYPDPPRNTTLLGYQLALVGFHDSGSGMESRILHNETLWPGWYSFGMQDLGGISYKNGVLCWTAVDHILCGQWSATDGLTTPKDIETVLAPGEATTTCSSGEAGTYSSVTTGVAVVETPGEAGRLGLLYGCWSGRLGAGGMGLLTITRPQGTRTLTKITDESGPIFAGTLFVTDENFCGIETSTSTTAQTTSPTGSVPQSVTADMGRFIVTVIWGVMTKKFLCIS